MPHLSKITFFGFVLIYLLLFLVMGIFRFCQLNKSKLLFISSLRMSIQLIITGFVLTFILEHPHPIFTVLFLTGMLVFATAKILNSCGALKNYFKFPVIFALSISSLGVLFYFVAGVIGQNFLHPQYTIPLAGMMIGNSMTGIMIAIQHFSTHLTSHKNQIMTLTNLGVTPGKILKPFFTASLNVALTPTINSMIGMGIVFLPGMMTGQILSGTSPNTAIVYQIATMITITTCVCFSVFFSLFLSQKRFITPQKLISIPSHSSANP